MAGLIIGFYGYQRSGKTLFAYKLAKHYSNKGCPVYTNLDSPSFIKIEALSQIPLNNAPKVLLLDEVYSFLDSRNWKDNTNTSLFFNTIGKQNILLLMTAINPDTVEVRLRKQHNYMVIAKGDKDSITYKVIDTQRNITNVINVNKSPELFSCVDYDSQQIPDIIDCDLSTFSTKVKAYNQNIKQIRERGV